MSVWMEMESSTFCENAIGVSGEALDVGLIVCCGLLIGCWELHTMEVSSEATE